MAVEHGQKVQNISEILRRLFLTLVYQCSQACNTRVCIKHQPALLLPECSLPKGWALANSGCVAALREANVVVVVAPRKHSGGYAVDNAVAS